MPSAVHEKAKGLVAENYTIMKEDFKKILIYNLLIYSTEEDFVELFLQIDPLFTNLVSSNTLEGFLSSEIIE